jgi:pimeloyl-ACP methyl ester carboxylesterase
MFLLPQLPDATVVALADRGEFFVRTHFGATGTTPVLMIHGWGVSADTNFFTIYEELRSNDISFIAPDLRGHGRSVRSGELFSFENAADDLEAILDALNIERVTLFGFSMGGAIALKLADRHPDRIDGVVIGSSAGSLNRWGAHRLRGPFAFFLTRILRSDRRSEVFLRRFLDHTELVAPEMKAFRSWYHGELRRGSVRDIAEAGREIARFSLDTLSNPEALCAFRTAVLATEHDSAVPVSRQLALAKYLDARTYRLPGDHDVLLTHRKLYVETLVNAIKNVQSVNVSQL